MLIRHIAAAANVSPDGLVVDPERVRHGVIQAGRLAALGAEIDPLTHLNLDFPHHRVDLCVVAERLEVGSSVAWTTDGLRSAQVKPQAYRRLGPVDLDARRLEWLQAVQERRNRRTG